MASSLRDLSYVCRTEGSDTGPPWLPAGGGTLLRKDGLPSLQYGASSLLGLVYDRQSSASQSFSTADDVGDWTAVEYTARSTSSTSFSPQSPFDVIATAQLSTVDVNLESADKVPVISENHQTDLSSDVVAELSPSHLLNSIETSGVSAHSDTTTTVDLLSESTLLPVSDVDELRYIYPSDKDSKSSTNTSAVALNVEDYLLSNLDKTQHGLVNGWANVDSNEVGVVRQNDVLRNMTVVLDVHTHDAETLRQATHYTDAIQTLDLSLSSNELEVTSQTVAAVSLSCNDACRSVFVNENLHSTTSDATDPCRVCYSSAVQPLSSSTFVRSDVNSNVTSLISTSADDRELDETESRDIQQQCQRVAERLTEAWGSSGRRADMLDGYDHIDGDNDLLPNTIPTLTTRSIHVR